MWSSTFIVVLMMAGVAQVSSLTRSIEIAKSTRCGNVEVQTNYDAKVDGTGISPGGPCTFTFNAETTKDGCKGICYQMNAYALFNDSKITLTLTVGSDSKSFTNGSKVSSVPVCSNKTTSMTAMLDTESDYVYNDKYPGFVFTFEVYHQCSKRGMVKNQDYETVVKEATGYHDKEEFEEKVRSNYIAGILLGFGLASIFLVVLLFAWCYTKNSPNRGPDRSVGMPKVGGFKKKMNINKAEKKEPAGMAVSYSKNADKDEQERLLIAGSATAAGAVVVTVDDDDDDDDKHKSGGGGGSNDCGTHESGGGGGGDSAACDSGHSSGGGGGGGGYSYGGGDSGGGGGGGGDSGGGGGGDSGGGGSDD